MSLLSRLLAFHSDFLDIKHQLRRSADHLDRLATAQERIADTQANLLKHTIAWQNVKCPNGCNEYTRLDGMCPACEQPMDKRRVS